MTMLSPLAIELINRFQGGFPLLASRPFAVMAEALGMREDEVLATIGELVGSGHLSRFGPIYDASRLGGGQTLAALQAPEQRFDAVAATVNALPAVAHNYRRDHRLNMWFVVAAPQPAEVEQALTQIERDTGLRVFNFPKLREFYLGLWLELDVDGGVRTVPVPLPEAARPGQVLDAVDLHIVAVTQGGLPLVQDPVGELAQRLEIERQALTYRLQAMLDSGAIRRIGAVPNHYRMGLRGNGMTVWDVPDDMAVALGEQVGALDFVSHSYLRPRYPGKWNYNLFAMVHGHDRTEVLDKTQQVEAILGPHCRAHDILFSTAVLKKTGLRLAA